ncbi:MULTISPECIES: hypothetical protein [unclassified Colwellia]|uniref:hypothetical protein n=1 Tax=unclassified Colwellia TaxID=196834 RepID=UPI0015F4E4F1|nr:MULTISPECIES: hypothetical protein [unclassified Colwellia]MBA6233778.1 hypothetical protein [Colwellia sp. MB02u-7]MBA6237406.1 hypothetical protein [Colwellia sp. MB02u-11]MBA6257156.1 hypothetical protein [Colwellia sp. MB3u-28]MBA6258741.1 hypothetical protein [Colwellia sp. MB3u-41]MBA6300406.1 hypothetical protein [Colwellia sp. MB3u-22]
MKLLIPSLRSIADRKRSDLLTYALRLMTNDRCGASGASQGDIQSGLVAILTAKNRRQPLSY